MDLPPEYILFKFNQYVGGVKFNKSANTYQGSCPICREGDSWLKKKRCYYLLKEEIIYCFNCGWSSKPIKWIKEVTGNSTADIFKEAEDYDLVPFESFQTKGSEIKNKSHILPYDSINLFDNIQITHYSHNLIVNKALKVINDRRLNTAVNKPDSLWVSLKDSVHKNRLIIPFYSENHNIEFYQSRTILDTTSNIPKYLSKRNSEKSLFGLDNIDANEDHIFILEGPINAFFVKNSTAVCGIQEKSETSFTPKQQSQLNMFRFLKRVWVLDSQWIDKASFNKTQTLINQNESVFIWPQNIGKQFKDFNDICIYMKKDEIGKNFILQNTYTGLMAKLKLSTIR